MRHLFLVGAAIAFSSLPAKAETTLCKEITTVPFTITQGGAWCLKKDLATNMASGDAITIEANNVVIDFNDFKLGNLAAGERTQANGITSNGYLNISIRNGTIRGFYTAIFLQVASTDTFASHRIENMLLDSMRGHALALLNGKGSLVRGNRIVNTGTATNGVVSGIQTNGTYDVVIEDNIISNVKASNLAAGIYTIHSDSGVIAGNRISSINGNNESIGIDDFQSNYALADANTLMKGGVLLSGYANNFQPLKFSFGKCSNNISQGTSIASSCYTAFNNSLN